MTTQTYVCRLFGGRDVGVTFDGTNIGILGQTITLPSLSAALQAQFTSAVANAPPQGSRPAFGGDNISSAVGSILDNQPTWPASANAALTNYVNEQTLGGQVASVETFNR